MIRRASSEPDYGDPFCPPDKSVPVMCLHCGDRYSSEEIRWNPEAAGGRGLWVCPTDDCDGAGFGWDILPLPGLRSRRGGPPMK